MTTTKSKGRIFAYRLYTSWASPAEYIYVCPQCAKSMKKAVDQESFEKSFEPCYYKDYSFGYEVLGCEYEDCNRTLKTPF